MFEISFPIVADIVSPILVLHYLKGSCSLEVMRQSNTAAVHIRISRKRPIPIPNISAILHDVVRLFQHHPPELNLANPKNEENCRK